MDSSNDVKTFFRYHAEIPFRYQGIYGCCLLFSCWENLLKNPSRPLKKQAFLILNFIVPKISLQNGSLVLECFQEFLLNEETINEEKNSWQSIWEICQSFTKKPFLGTLPLDYSASILSFMQRTQFVSLHLIFYGTVKCCLVLTNIHICICTNSTKY